MLNIGSIDAIRDILDKINELTRFSWTGSTIHSSYRLNGDCVPSRRACPAKFFMVFRQR